MELNHEEVQYLQQYQANQQATFDMCLDQPPNCRTGMENKLSDVTQKVVKPFQENQSND